MGKLSARKKMVKRNVEIDIVAPEAVEYVDPLDGRIAAIQLLIPLGLASRLRGAAAGGGRSGR